MENLKMKKNLVVVAGLLLLANLATAQSNSSLTDAQNKICGLLEQFYDLFLYIASGIGALVIVIQGVIWVASADNTKARTAAKVAIVHAIIGLIIVSIAIALVNLALPEGSGCIATW